MNYPNGGRVYCNRAEPVNVDFCLTGAADVNANGYTVTDSGGIVSAAAKTAEGDLKITLREPLRGFRCLRMISTRADSKLTLDSVADINTPSDPHIHVTFTEAGSDADPDGATMYFVLEAYRTTIR
jgi:hypothetical protein